MQINEEQRQALNNIKKEREHETEFPKDLKWKHVMQLANQEQKADGATPDQVFSGTIKKAAAQLTKTRRKYDGLRSDLTELEQKMKSADQLEAAKLSVQYLSKQAELNELVEHYNSALPQLASELISYISKTSNKLNNYLHEDHKKVSDITQF